ncbi:hypothetical protein [Psychrobacter sp. W2-37-MNA-CIBAN-0211]|uniref:hypothetical protein n=1 Tax=Psychrobacter sp. W2-37-MNA-CIBAN-0211 TaxID=3140443 RepID=UPI003317FC1D
MRVIEGGNTPVDRYFVALVEVFLPWGSHKDWVRSFGDTFLFEQPTQLSYDEILATAAASWTIATDFEVTNFYELSAADYKVFMGDDSQWTVIEE